MRRRAFTYIEMFVVWSIIAVLAAILFPVFARARSKAYQANCLTNLMNIGVGLRMYAHDNSGHFPLTNNDLWPLVPQFLPDPGVLLCPSAIPLNQGPQPGRLPREPQPGQSDFVYWGGACDDDLPSYGIAADDDAFRHDGLANVLWVDGHVKAMSSIGMQYSSDGITLNDLRILKPDGIPFLKENQTEERPRNLGPAPAIPAPPPALPLGATESSESRGGSPGGLKATPPASPLTAPGAPR
jgi:prepilin-type processing-associated H-X9-DG protein